MDVSVVGEVKWGKDCGHGRRGGEDNGVVWIGEGVEEM